MGLLLKIILFGIAVYAVWKTFHRWKGLWDKFVGKPDEPARPAPPPPPPSSSAPIFPPVLKNVASAAVPSHVHSHSAVARIDPVGVVDRGGGATYFAAPQQRP